MKILRTTLATALAACVLSVGAHGYALAQKKDERKDPPPKTEKVVPKGEKEPKGDERRNSDRDRGGDKGKKRDN